jgi:hypothetical protein
LVFSQYAREFIEELIVGFVEELIEGIAIMGIITKDLVRVSIDNWSKICPRVYYYNCNLFCFLCNFGSNFMLMIIYT